MVEDIQDESYDLEWIDFAMRHQARLDAQRNANRPKRQRVSLPPQMTETEVQIGLKKILDIMEDSKAA